MDGWMIGWIDGVTDLPYDLSSAEYWHSHLTNKLLEISKLICTDIKNKEEHWFHWFLDIKVWHCIPVRSYIIIILVCFLYYTEKKQKSIFMGLSEVKGSWPNISLPSAVKNLSYKNYFCGKNPLNCIVLVIFSFPFLRIFSNTMSLVRNIYLQFSEACHAWQWAIDLLILVMVSHWLYIDQ